MMHRGVGILRALVLLAFALAALPMRAEAGTDGVNGNLTITAANTVVNLYDVAVSASGRTIVTTNIANLQNTALGPVGPGSVLLVYQAQGATIDATNTTTYGNVTAYNGAGYYEFVTVGSVSGNTITIATSCNALAHTYGTTTQIVRVPQYQALTVNAGASITATAWNGSTGGIVAIDAVTIALGGSIVTTGEGFRGAVAYSNGGASFQHVPPITAYVTGQTGAQLASALAAEKGESIAGNGTAYDASFGGRYGRGAPANGGGGGDGHNGGGGGGSNGDNGLTWSGQGLEDTNYDAYYADTNLLNPSGAPDPGYGSMKSGSGGGRGGYTYGQAPLSGYPDDGKRPVGGLGGRPMNYAGGAASRIFFGGGGGAGDSNNGGGGSGGNGGGVVLLRAGTVSGAGSIVASGAGGGNSSSQDAAGGGGGGGAVVVVAKTGTVATITAAGGAGGSQVAGGGEADGTGGGGGGGYVAATATTVSVAGGAEGVTGGPTTVTNGFAPYGATLGATGGTTAAPATYVYCYTPVIGAAKLASTINNGDGTFNVTYSVFLQNYGDTPLTTLTATDDLTVTFPTGTTFSIANAPAVVATSTGAGATVNPTYNGNSVKTLMTAGTLPIGGNVTVTFTVKIVPPAGTQTYLNSLTASAAGTTGNANGVTTADTSNNGSNPDPAGYANPNQTSENVATPITIYGQSPMTKTVRNVTTNEANGLTTDNALPGNQLEYTISFPNATGIGLKSIVVTDVVPANTTFKSAACGALASGVTACTASISGSTVTYTVTGTLASGATQTFLLDVTVN